MTRTRPIFCARCERDTFAVNGRKESKNRSNKGQAANFNNLYQFVSEQADLATDAVYSEKELSSHELYLVLQKAPPG